MLHGVLAAGFLAIVLLTAWWTAGDLASGYVSEGTQSGWLLGGLSLGFSLLIAGGLVLWMRTGHRAFVLVPDGSALGFVVAFLWWLIFIHPLAWFGLIGLAMLCPLIAIVVPPPRRLGTNLGN